MEYATNILNENVTWCHEGFTDIEYGLLYNWYTATDVRGIAPTGWHIPTDTEYKTLEIAIGMAPATADLFNPRGTTEGGELKEIGLTHWDSPNTGATDEWGFGLRGGGNRGFSGAFEMFKQYAALWSSTTGTGGMAAFAFERQFSYNSSQINRNYGFKYYGHYLRAIKNDATDPGIVTDYDGNKYHTVKIGTQVWMAANLIVKHYNDGSLIVEERINANWASLVTGAWCYYNNDPAKM